MEIKKSPKANLEGKKLLFREIGLIIALLICYAGFEWSTSEKEVSTLTAETEIVAEEEIIPITQETPPPPPEAPKEPVVSDFIDIVDDDVQVDDRFRAFFLKLLVNHLHRSNDMMHIIGID